jgi:signal transduction histidine kinase
MPEGSLSTLIALGRSVLAESELGPVLERVLAAAQEVTGARYAALGVLDSDRRRLERFVTAGIDEATRRALGDPPRGHGVLGELIREPKPLRLPDVSAHPRSYGFPVGHPPMTTFLGVPVLIGGEAWGNLYLADKHGGEFTAEDEAAVVMLAEWAGIAVENARRLEDVRNRRDELERTLGAMSATVEISRALAGETDLDRILQLIAKRGRALVGARVLAIELVQGDRLRIAAAAGEIDQAVVGEEIDALGSVAERVLRERTAQRLSDDDNRARFEKVGLGTRFADDVKAGLLVPLAFRTEAPGVIVALNPVHGGEFTADDERLLSSFAVSAASAVVTARSLTLEQLRAREAATEDERRRWTRELHDETLQGLGALRLALSAARRLEDPERWKAAIGEAIAELDTEIASLRGIIADVRPASLDELGTLAALEALADRTRSRGVEVALVVDLDYEAGRTTVRPDPELETAVYRVVQEAVNNAVKHAGADDVAVTVREQGHVIMVRVSDEGHGFDPGEPARGYGLVGMRERVESLGGALAIESSPGTGTTVTVRLPVLRTPAQDASIAGTPASRSAASSSRM